MNLWRDIQAAFVGHHRHYANDCGLKNVQALGAEKVLTQQYAGRVPFELLQNALDRCDHQVRILRTQTSLIVANDGKPIGVLPRLDHDSPPEDLTQLSNFHALCSNHTSNKSPDENTGNKGVGFRSAFSLSKRVVVWTRAGKSAEWWGLVLCDGMTPLAWQRECRASAVKAGLDVFLESPAYPGRDERPRPSFHFPVPMRSDRFPTGFSRDLSGMSTIIEVPLLTDKAKRRADAALNELADHHLDFLALKRRRGSIEVVLKRHRRSTHTWTIENSRKGASVARWVSQEKRLLKMAREAGLNLTEAIHLGVRWPPPPEESDTAKAHDGKIYCYLATEAPAPLGADFHADFQLGIDRTKLELKPNEAAGAYNRALLERLADIQMAMVLAHMGAQKPLPASAFGRWPHVRLNQVVFPARRPKMRSDLWRFLDPGRGLKDLPASEQILRRFVVTQLKAHLFGEHELNQPAAWKGWARLAAAFFDGTPRPTRSYREFWTATVNWINTSWPTRYDADPSRAAVACLRALRTAKAQAVPVTDHDGKSPERDEETPHGLVPPEIKASGTPVSRRRKPERLFQSLGEDVAVDVPKVIRQRGREVTAWHFHSYFCNKQKSLLGSAQFDRPTLLAELRQLGAKTTPRALAARPRYSPKQQRQLVAYAARLFTLKVSRNQTDLTYATDTEKWKPGWRALLSSKDLCTAGNALATLFLKCTDGRWRPARQCHYHRIHKGFLRALLNDVPALEADRGQLFFTFLGVCTRPDGLLLVEGGAVGVVPSQASPPAIVDSASGRTPGLKVVLGVEGALGDTPCNPKPSKTKPLHVLKAVTAAWEDKWIRQVGSSSSDGEAGTSLVDSLATLAWFPVGDRHARPPEGLGRDIPNSVAPIDLTLVARGDPRITKPLWRVTATGELAHMLMAMGARDLDGLCSDPKRTLRAIGALATHYPKPNAVHIPPQVALGLEEFFARAISGLVEHDVRWPLQIKLLAYLPADRKGGINRTRLGWRTAKNIHVADSNANLKRIRQFFGDRYALLVSSITSRKVKGTLLEGRTLSLDNEIRYRELAKDDGNPGVWCELDEFLPKLIALAFVSPRRSGVVDPVDIRKRWHNTTFKRATDVWTEWRIPEDAGGAVATPRKDRFDDVVAKVVRKEKKVVSSVIYFDVLPNADPSARPIDRPPLAYFAEALAESLVDRGIESDWKSALAEVDADKSGSKSGQRLDAFLERSGVDGRLVQQFKLDLRPLNTHQLAAHRARVVRALQRLDLRLADDHWNLMRGTILHSDDLAGNRACRAEAEVQQVLADIGWEPHEEPYAVSFSCTTSHLHQWETWLDEAHRRIRILRWKHGQKLTECPRIPELLRGSFARELRLCGESEAHRLDFDPEQVALGWMGRLDLKSIDALLPAYQPSDYAAIQGGIETVSIKAVPLVHDRVTRGEYATTERDWNIRNAVRAAKGREAERVLLNHLLPTTCAILKSHGKAAWDAMQSAMRVDGSMWKRVDAIRTSGEPDYEGLMHVSNRWSSAGFDILALELDASGRPQPVRYEVKSLPEAGSKVIVFVSLNELNVLRAVGRRKERWAKRGRWVLVGVSQTGKAIDLTGCLAAVVNKSARELPDLAQKGILPDGLRIVVTVGK